MDALLSISFSTYLQIINLSLRSYFQKLSSAAINLIRALRDSRYRVVGECLGCLVPINFDSDLGTLAHSKRGSS